MDKEQEFKECKHCDKGKVPIFIPDENSDEEKFIGYEECSYCDGTGEIPKESDDYTDEQDAIDDKADMARD